MQRPLTAVSFFSILVACSSSSSSGPSSAVDGGGACPAISGDWKITAHCDSSLIGDTLEVKEQADCSLSFSAPFDAFTGSVSDDGAISIGGPQSCTGSASANAISMSCTPGSCTVTLAR